MPPSDELDTIIAAVTADYPPPAAGPRQPYPVLRFALGTALWVTVAILAYCLGWLLVHG